MAFKLNGIGTFVLARTLSAVRFKSETIININLHNPENTQLNILYLPIAALVCFLCCPV